MWKWLVALSLIATPALAQEHATAYDALRVVSAHLGRASLNHVISVTGANGDPQPETWQILLEDSRSPTGTREVQVKDGRIAADRTPERVVIGSTANSTIKTARLNLDSSGAFSVASHTADKSNTRFALVNYTLRVGERGDPVWIVTLQGTSGRPVGTIHVNCNRGNVVRSEGMFAGATMEDVVEDRSYQREETRTETRTDTSNSDVDEDGDERGPLYPVKRTVKNAFFRAQDEARGMWDRVHRSFDDFMKR